MPSTGTKFIMFIRAAASFTPVGAGAEPSKALKCSRRKPSDQVDDEEENSMNVRLTISSSTNV